LNIDLLNGIDPDQVFYFQQPHFGIIYSVVDGKVVVEHESIASLKTYQLVVANLSSEHWGRDTIDMVYNLLEDHSINFIMLSHQLADHQARPKLFFYPYWYRQSRHYHLETYTSQVVYDTCTYKVSCLNRIARPHRIYNWLMLQKKAYAQDTLVTINNDVNVPPILSHIVLDPDTLSEWESVKYSIPDVSKNLGNQLKIFDITHPAYSDSYINLVTETIVYPTLFVTEKTWKPIVAGQLFLVLGCQHIIGYLRDCGVDVFADIIDHKYYDNESDWQVRLTRIHSIIDDLVKQDLSAIYRETFTRRVANQTKYLKGDFGDPYTAIVTQQLI
jgi:hypothetical protein